MGLIFVRAFGLGPLSGVLAIFVADTGTLSKLYSEAADNSDNKQIEGLISSGSSKLSTIRFGLMPQVIPIFISQSLYFFESNSISCYIRNSWCWWYRPTIIRKNESAVLGSSIFYYYNNTYHGCIN